MVSLTYWKMEEQRGKTRFHSHELSFWKDVAKKRRRAQDK